MNIDGENKKETLMDIVKFTLSENSANSVVGFKDNSSAIRGGPIKVLLPSQPTKSSPLQVVSKDWDLLLTAETHNFPCAVAPYPGAETGSGGRIRDTHATGRGSIMGVGTAGYCVGNLRLDDREGTGCEWENKSFAYPENLASPLQILLDSSDGASDYGNKFGEPVVAGYTRTYGVRLPNGERREWLKPIMFSGGIGQIDHTHLEKYEPEKEMLVVKIGGPAYRIGMGGGAASSVPSGSNKAELDFNAVQRGDAEMAQKLWRVVRCCVELGDKNPVISLHDQGAGGNCNVVKEIVDPLGADINIRQVALGDNTLSVLEIWGAEYQENDCLLIKPESQDLLKGICDRERCIMQVIGYVTGSGKVIVRDPEAKDDEPDPAVELELDRVLGKMPQKTFTFKTKSNDFPPIEVQDSAQQLLEKVLRLTAVGSKRFLTSKVDRCVTGLVAQQQCVGPLQLPLSNVAVMAQSHFGTTGVASAIGEQPYKGMIDPSAMARLALSECLLNLVWAQVSGINDIKSSVNWMYAAKMDGEGADMYLAAEALRSAMIELGVAIDGGKDSLSMAALADGENVKAPGNLVISAYVFCPDITKTVTPDLKQPGSSTLLHIDVSMNQNSRELGGSAVAQVLNQIGDKSPDVDVKLLKKAFLITQDLISNNKILAGHDISDGGIAVSLLEMAFSGNCGILVDMPQLRNNSAVDVLFAEEPGLVIEVENSTATDIQKYYTYEGVSCKIIGETQSQQDCRISVGGQSQIQGSTAQLRDFWESTSFQLEMLQRSPECVRQEQQVLLRRQSPKYNLTYTPEWTSKTKLASTAKIPVAVIREEGSNGDREMAAALHTAGFEAWDVTMTDLVAGKVQLSDFRGIVFVGGFSYADVLDSAKGWAATIRFNSTLLEQFNNFYSRQDTFSLGVCNGCQLMALLGWVPGKIQLEDQVLDEQQPRFVHNQSGRFECRWVNVGIKESPAIMLKDMAGSHMGVWIAHGEGRVLFPNQDLQREVSNNNLAPIRYVDGDCVPSEMYPYNPNGSPLGIAALCSQDGRHLAMMPHPERCFLGWQNPWIGGELIYKNGPGSWLKMFQNAREWCEKL
eukprot:TRINITY_DN1283_c0_g1_i2.p1 TRINITY_DN1283_c0_g1~~TRINITY_DN1283_c0_g1_i2.p1  ORF type:complete len:1144 (-),score=144.19 TRINITY_DN1283_c0_g1_i2:439-3681(-)